MDMIIKQRFIEYLQMLEKKKVPKILETAIVEKRDNYIKCRSLVNNALVVIPLGKPPIETYPLLGLVLFGEFFPFLLDGISKELDRKRKN